MHLKQLSLSGFKSFAKKTTLQFTQGITAIVGPNGSGKSNLAESIRWVMGEQSIKTLRGKKSEDVIFSGSDKKTRLGLAEVCLELDNSDKQVPIDYSELAITRRIYRSGESDYLINNAKSKLADINLLLTKANFGHRTYSVIGQGMIDNFLIASPAERKKFFEEATGVKQYQIKKQQALNKLEGVWQNLNTLKIKVAEMEPGLNLLTRQVKKLKRRQEIETELRQEKLQYYSAYWQEINQNYLSQKSKIDGLNSEKDKIYSHWQSLEKKLSQLTRNSSLNFELNKLRAEEQELLDQKIGFKEELLTLKVKEASRQTSAAIKNISQAELIRVNDKIIQINLSHQKLVSLLGQESNLALLKKEILAINKKIDELLDYLKPFIEPTVIKKDGLGDTGNDIPQRNTEASLSKINRAISSLQDKIKTLQEKDTAERASLWHLQKNFQDAQNKLNEINNQINELRINLARVETKHFDLKNEIQYELSGLENLSLQTLAPLSEQEKIIQHNKINKLKGQLELIGGLDPEIETEYQTIKKRHDFLSDQIDDLSQTSESLKKLALQLDEIIKHRVNKSFTEINRYFQKYFKTLFQGGKAELLLIKEKEKEIENDSGDENGADDHSPVANFFQEKNRTAGFSGIEVSATPPGKRLKSIASLSGGERALTSIALICAIISANPSPFVVLDEVDAALDEANSIRFAEILDSLSQQTQFVVITHNRATMERAKLLYGVTMGDDGVSKLLSIKLDQAKKYNQ